MKTSKFEVFLFKARPLRSILFKQSSFDVMVKLRRFLIKKFAAIAFLFSLTIFGCTNTNESGAGHKHTYSSEWTYNNEAHWHAATCEHTSETKDYAAHTYKAWVIDRPASIEAAGSKHRDCKVCPYVEVQAIPILAHDHQPGTPTEEDRVEPTCVDTGSYYEVTRCELCGEELSRVHHTIPATGQHGSATREENRVEPTCGQDGTYDKVTYCPVCGQEFSRTREYIPATGNHLHVHYEVIFHEDPTCTEPGFEYGQYICDDCGMVVGDNGDDMELEALGHDYVGVVTDPTYEAAGYTTYTCSRCGDTYTEPGAPKLEHHYSDEWSTDWNTHYHACTDPGYEDLKADVADHVFESSFVAPSYDESTDTWVDGYLFRHCTVCGRDNTVAMTKEQYDMNVSLGRFPEVDGDTVYYGLYPDELITDPNGIETMQEAQAAAHKYGHDAVFPYVGRMYRKAVAKNDGNGYTATTRGQAYYFTMPRVRWNIVERYDDGSALLLSYRILEGGNYDDDAATYADSQLRSRITTWSNHSTLDLMFGNDDTASNMSGSRYLMKHTVVNSGPAVQIDENNYDKYTSPDTHDLLHIPSLAEMVKWGNDVSQSLWIANPTHYAQAMNSSTINYVSGTDDFGWSWSYYWTRTPQSNTYVKMMYGRSIHFESRYIAAGKLASESTGVRLCARVQLDITKPCNFKSLAVLAAED